MIKAHGYRPLILLECSVIYVPRSSPARNQYVPKSRQAEDYAVKQLPLVDIAPANCRLARNVSLIFLRALSRTSRADPLPTPATS